MGQYVSSRSDSNGGAPSAVLAPAGFVSGWLRSLREILANGAIPVWSANGRVDETIHEASPPPSSKASRKRPLSPPASRPTQVPAAASAASNSAESFTQWHPGMPKKLLHLFSGPGGRSDGLRALARELLHVDTVEIDTLIDEHDCDLRDAAVFDDLMRRIRAGEFFAAVIGTPCSTFSVARIPKHVEFQTAGHLSCITSIILMACLACLRQIVASLRIQTSLSSDR